MSTDLRDARRRAQDCREEPAPGLPKGTPGPAGGVAARLSPGDLYRLRHAHLLAERRALEARLAANAAQWLVLRLEASYRILGSEATVDIHTGAIACPPAPGPPVAATGTRVDSP